MTESQLPAAAAAQKFGTLIPNRIFGELFFAIITSPFFTHDESWFTKLWRVEVCVKFLCDGG